MRECRNHPRSPANRKFGNFYIEIISKLFFSSPFFNFFRHRKKNLKNFREKIFVVKILKIRKSRFLKIFNFWRKHIFFFKIFKIFQKNIFSSFSNCSKKFSKKPISIIFDFLETYAPDTFIFSLFVTTRQDWGTLRHPYIW